RTAESSLIFDGCSSTCLKVACIVASPGCERRRYEEAEDSDSSLGRWSQLASFSAGKKATAGWKLGRWGCACDCVHVRIDDPRVNADWNEWKGLTVLFYC